MKTAQVQIKKGLMQMQNLLQGVANKVKKPPMNVSAPKLVSQHGRPVYPNRPPIPQKALPPLPQSLPSLQDNYGNMNAVLPLSSIKAVTEIYGNEGSNGVVPSNLDAMLNQSFHAEEVGDPIASQAPGPLAVAEDLKLYEDFAEWETKAMLANCEQATKGLVKLHAKNYQMEKMTPEHKSGYLMGVLIKYFELNFQRQGSSMTFTEFVTQISEADIMKIWNPFGGDVKEYVRRFKQGVRYLSSEKREKYNVGVKNGKLYWAKWGNDKPLDTTKPDFFKRKHEKFARITGKDDIAIWVMSKEEKLYTHAAKLHRFHHSSFTGGDEIICAGEWRVEGGKLAWLSGASGHYQPTFDNLASAITSLTKVYGISPYTYMVKLIKTGDGSTKTDEFVSAAVFVKNLRDYQCGPYRVG